MKNDDSLQKESAVRTHSLQAGEFAASYANIKAESYANCFNYSRLRLDAWLERFLPVSGDGRSLLDVGCGTGHHLAWLRQRGYVVAGVDGSDEMLKRAKKNNPGVELIRADVENIPLPSGSFDFILSIELLRYLPNPEPVIQEMARLLKPGGACIVTAMPLFSINGYWFVNRLATRMPVWDLVRLKQFFTTSSRLKSACQKAGLTSVEIHGVYMSPFNWIERLLPRLMPGILKAWEPLDVELADRAVLREFSNMFVMRAIKK